MCCNAFDRIMKINKLYWHYQHFRLDRYLAPIDPAAAILWALRNDNWRRALLLPAILYGLLNCGELVNKFFFNVNPLLHGILEIFQWTAVALTSGYYWHMIDVWLAGGMEAEAIPWRWRQPQSLMRFFVAGLKIVLFSAMFLLPLQLWQWLVGHLPLAWLSDALVRLGYFGYLFLAPYALTAIITSARTQRLSDLFDSTRVIPLCRQHYKPCLKAVLIGGALMSASLPVFLLCACCGPLLGLLPACWMAFSYHLAAQAFVPARVSDAQE